MTKRKLTLREIQAEEYKILCKVTKYMDENNIYYVFAGGTLLGAIRHNGFIPWDDDIDIFLPRFDYEKLRSDIKKGKCKLENIEFRLPGDDKYPVPFIKAVNLRFGLKDDLWKEEFNQYLWVDIFPLDHYPDGNFLHRIWFEKIRMLVRVLNVGRYNDDVIIRKGYYSNPIKKIALMGAKIFYKLMGGYQGIAIRIDSIAQKANKKFRKSNHLANSVWPAGIKDYYRKEAIYPRVKHRFESGEFNIPQNYDLYLTGFFGDYMKIPPVERRIDHHLEVYELD